jgi:hypothetical protein
VQSKERIVVECKKAPSAGDLASITIHFDPHVRVFKAWNRIVPQEIVHYTVELVFGMRGFIRRLAEGVAPEQMEGRHAPVEARQAEILVGVYQSELWGFQATTNSEFGRAVLSACRKQGVSVPHLDTERIEKGRETLDDLAARWARLEPGAKMTLILPATAANSKT